MVIVNLVHCYSFVDRGVDETWNLNDLLFVVEGFVFGHCQKPVDVAIMHVGGPVHIIGLGLKWKIVEVVLVRSFDTVAARLKQYLEPWHHRRFAKISLIYFAYVSHFLTNHGVEKCVKRKEFDASSWQTSPSRHCGLLTFNDDTMIFIVTSF